MPATELAENQRRQAAAEVAPAGKAFCLCSTAKLVSTQFVSRPHTRRGFGCRNVTRSAGKNRSYCLRQQLRWRQCQHGHKLHCPVPSNTLLLLTLQCRPCARLAAASTSVSKQSIPSQ